jgi:hypothetical protein
MTIIPLPIRGITDRMSKRTKDSGPDTKSHTKELHDVDDAELFIAKVLWELRAQLLNLCDCQLPMDHEDLNIALHGVIDDMRRLVPETTVEGNDCDAIDRLATRLEIIARVYQMSIDPT